ncbi:integrase core domain-containing protein [Leptospira noguchii]|uniref:integrase core domain-containing protein n=1 Tax=Leptospira noguchii TaxID=28182 RepID=UPI001F05F3B4|nr:integrase core domain-containing protein [Leptospira noguchii]MCH1914666.1 integrase core domain-containing protein [Leptospira noguchii]UOG64581.1 integrase core domain-containing protein [Leptospira noguchii]
MDSIHFYHNPWFWVFIFEKIILYFLWKVNPKHITNFFTILRNQYRKLFKLHLQGRPGIREYWNIYHQIQDMLKNKDWGAARIHSELLLLGFDVSLTSVKRIIQRILKWYNHFRGNWNVWLNLISQIKNYTIAMDLCRIQTIYGNTLYALAFIHLGSRKIIHFNITLNPTRLWVLNQIQEAKSIFPEFEILLRDNDVLFSGKKILQGLEDLGIQSLHTPIASPWCNAIMERWFGSLRRECLNHIPIFSLNHAHLVVQEYINYYNLWRPHLSLNKDSPYGRTVTFPSPTSKVIKRKVLGGLHHIYFHSEAEFEKCA